MNILGKIFGAEKVITAGMALIDNMHTSSEEEIAAKSKARTDLLNAYAPFKVAQRLLALMFAVTFLFCFVLVLGMTLIGHANITEVRAVISEFWIGEIMLTIIGFYFGGGAFEGVMSARGKK